MNAKRLTINFRRKSKFIHIVFYPERCSYEHLNGNLSPNLLDPYPFTRSELSFNGGIGVTLDQKWSIGARLSHSILSVRRAVPTVSKAVYNFNQV